MQAHRTLADAYSCAGLDGAMGELATHSMRKTYAATMFDHFGDIFAVQRALRHRSPASTVAYLSFNEQDLEHAVAIKWPDEGQQPAEPEGPNIVAISRKEA
jgi:site-specific recombinase XerC